MSKGLIGRVLGPVSNRSGSTLVFSPGGQGYDFAISGIPFRVAISDARKYERATADFRKEQFDASATVGDQSLTGWWLRSQLSFHKGAGIKYYEPLDGEEVEHRFRDSEGIDPRVPGVVTLCQDANDYNTSVLDQLTDAPSARAEALAAVTTGLSAVLINGTTTTALTPATVGNVRDVTSNGTNTYFATAGGIEQVPAAGTTLTSLRTSSNPIRGVWWAKGRLFAVDTTGDWHAAAATSGALDAGTLAWSSGLAPATDRPWSLADTPGAVMIAHGSEVFAITIDTEGVVPTLAGGIVAAQLPNDETIKDITYSLGYLIICTDKGVRVAVAQDTQLIFGPLLVEGEAGTASVQGTTAYIGVKQDDRTGVFALNLTQQITELEPAWFYERDVGGTTAPLVHVATDAVRYYAGTLGVMATGADRQSTGHIDIGFIRYGTLEPKKFHTVKVWVGAEKNPGGTVTISTVAKDGTVTSLYTFEASTATSEDVTLRLTDPQDYIGLRFTLARDSIDATKTPELLGYQLRALPAPVRQRLIRIPLLCFDTERTTPARTTGREGDAWRRLDQLEAAEDSGGLHTYQDFRTGESGTAYVERVEFENATPPDQRSTGFGGIVWLTIRKVT